MLILCETATSGDVPGVVRPIEIARIARHEGWQVVVVASSVSNQHLARARVGVHRSKGAVLVRLAGGFPGATGARRAANMIGFGLLTTGFALTRFWRSRYRPDIVVTSSTGGLDGLAGLAMKFIFGARWVVEIRDIWPESVTELKPDIRTFGFLRLVGLMRRLAIRHSDGLLSPLVSANALMNVPAKRARPFCHIPNCAPDSRELRAGNRLSHQARALIERIRESRAHGRPVAAYFGSFNLANGIGRLAAMCQAIPHDKATILFVGNGEESGHLEWTARERPNVIVHPALPSAELPNVMREVDVLIFGIPRIAVHRFGLSPIKYADYLSAGKPIFFWGPAQSLAGHECGHLTSVEGDDPEAAGKVLLALLEEPQEARDLAGATARRIAERKFRYARYRRKLGAFLRSVHGREP